jgi:hypothetical protein
VSTRAKNYLIIVLAAATTVSGFIAWNQNQRLTALREERLKVSATPAKPKAAPVTATFTDPVAATAKPAADVESAAPAEEPGATRQRGNNNNRANFAALMANPEFAKAMSLQQRAGLDTRYAALFKQLNLQPAELEKFKNLLVERQNSRMDVMNAARESGLNPRENRDEINKLVSEAQAEVDANIKAALGDTRFTQYQSYDSTQSQRNLVSQLDQRLSYSSTQLNATQSQFLVTALASTNAPVADQGGPGNWGGGGNRTTITDEVIQQAQSVLSPDQVSALKQLQSEQQAQQKIRDMMRAGGGNTAPRTTGT